MAVVETASCAFAMLAPRSRAIAMVKIGFIELVEKLVFQSVIGCRRSRCA